MVSFEEIYLNRGLDVKFLNKVVYFVKECKDRGKYK